MADFAKAIEVILKHEGGYVVDHAGPTNWGITLATLEDYYDDVGFGDINSDQLIDYRDVRDMPRDTAVQIYKSKWWDRYEYGKIDNQEIATKIFDFSVNMGAPQAHRIAQRALRGLGIKISDDGILGPISFRSLNQVYCCLYLPAIRCEAAGFYRGLVMKNPSFNKYLEGWLNRAYS